MVLTLSLGFAANTAVFSVVDAVLLRPLPVADPSQVLFQWTSGPSPAVGYLTGEWWQKAATGRVTTSSFLSGVRGDRSTTLAATFAWAELRRASLTVEGEAELAAGQLVSGGYYSGLGVPAILGRTIRPEDDRAGTELVAVIGHGYWLRRLGGAPGVLGRRGTLDGRPFTIIGVSPRGFSGTLPVGRPADASVPLLAWRARTRRKPVTPSSSTRRRARARRWRPGSSAGSRPEARIRGEAYSKLAKRPCTVTWTVPMARERSARRRVTRTSNSPAWR